MHMLLWIGLAIGGMFFLFLVFAWGVKVRDSQKTVAVLGGKS
ncbi:hypothetical protein [Laceyella putida]